MFRVLFVTHSSYPHKGGKSTHIQCLMAGLSSLGVLCDVISFSDINHIKVGLCRRAVRLYRLKGEDSHCYHHVRMYNALLRRQLAKHLATHSYDVISCQDALSCAIAFSVLPPNAAVTLTMHTYFGLEYLLDYASLSEQNPYYQRLLADELACMKRVRTIIAVDERIKAHVLETAKRLKVSPRTYCIPNFVDTDKFHPSARPKDGALHILCVRRLVEKNGVSYAIQAMLGLPETICLDIIGDGPQRPCLEALVQKLGLTHQVRFLGAMEHGDTVKAYANGCAAVVPSITVSGLQEATSISALEAMACALPTVASNIGGLSGLIEDGVTGFLVNEKDAAALHNCFLRLAMHPAEAEAMGQRARQYVEAHHSQMSAAGQYLKIFQSTAQKV